VEAVAAVEVVAAVVEVDTSKSYLKLIMDYFYNKIIISRDNYNV